LLAGVGIAAAVSSFLGVNELLLLFVTGLLIAAIRQAGAKPTRGMI